MSHKAYRIPTPARIAFSGGRTSGYMLFHVIEAFNGRLPDDVVVTFANTGREYEETLEFVRDCERNWGVPIRWVEYCRDETKPVIKVGSSGSRLLIGCHSFREVTFETASRNGEPFEAIINVKADFREEAKDEPPVLPNPTDRWCSGELKTRTMDRFMKAIGYTEYEVIVGLRADEPGRVRDLYAQETQKIGYYCPLYNAGVKEENVLAFWRRQPFDLKLRHDSELGTYEGNCDLCFLKRRAKIERILNERPEVFDWWADMERETGQRFRRDRVSYQELADRRVSLQMCDDVDLGTCMCTD